MVELALCLPLVVLLLMGVIQVAVVVRDQLVVQHAAREAARAASVSASPAAAAAMVVGAVAPGASVVVTTTGDRVTATVTSTTHTDVPLIGVFVPDVAADCDRIDGPRTALSRHRVAPNRFSRLGATKFRRWWPVACRAVDLVCRTVTIGGLPTLQASGEIDLSTVPMLHDALRRLVADHLGQTVAIDLDGITVLDDTGLGVLLGAAGRARDQAGDLVIVCTTERLLHRFDLSGLSRAVEVRGRARPLSAFVLGHRTGQVVVRGKDVVDQATHLLLVVRRLGHDHHRRRAGGDQRVDGRRTVGRRAGHREPSDAVADLADLVSQQRQPVVAIARRELFDRRLHHRPRDVAVVVHGEQHVHDTQPTRALTAIRRTDVAAGSTPRAAAGRRTREPRRRSTSAR